MLLNAFEDICSSETVHEMYSWFDQNHQSHFTKTISAWGNLTVRCSIHLATPDFLPGFSYWGWQIQKSPFRISHYRFQCKPVWPKRCVLILISCKVIMTFWKLGPDNEQNHHSFGRRHVYIPVALDDDERGLNRAAVVTCTSIMRFPAGFL